MNYNEYIAEAERAILALCKRLNRYAHKLTAEELRSDAECTRLGLTEPKAVTAVIDHVKVKLQRGVKPFENEVIFNTGPHHDDIMLGIMPIINRQLRCPSNEVHFGIATSGYNSVNNDYLSQAIADTLSYLRQGEIQMVNYPDFFEQGYRLKRDKDVYHYLDNVAGKNSHEMRRGFCHRFLRNAVGIWHPNNLDGLVARFEAAQQLLANEPQKAHDDPELQQLKGMIREFEEELVWAYTGVSVKNVHHLHLGFYKDSHDFPNRERDVEPVLQQLHAIKPTTISVIMDPMDVGPTNTHYKVLQTIAKAIEAWNEEADLSQLKIMGYRNVWSTFALEEANIIVPVSLNNFAVIEKAFRDSYLTQVEAEFPNPNFDGTFSELSESIWVRQLKDVQLLLGKDYFYENQHPLIRATHGLIFLKQMNVEEFLHVADQMKH
ncbi:MAG: hypothetical protein MJZ94_01350 [Bacteroidales bacterium]|nr:hypothetical protein [Bacteroidales bacterium]